MPPVKVKGGGLNPGAVRGQKSRASKEDVLGALVGKPLTAPIRGHVLLGGGLIKPDSQSRAVSNHRLAEMGQQRCYHFIKTGVDI